MLPSNQIFQVEWRVLRALNGWQLKAYILLSNSPKPLTCSEVATTLGTESRNIWLALTQLVERCYLVRKDGKYETAKFGGTPLADSIPHEHDSILRENSCLHEEKFPHTPLKENPGGVEVVVGTLAPARPRDVDIYFSRITEDNSLRPFVAEFLRGLRADGIDPATKTDLREHFTKWLPKYKAVKEIEEKRLQRSSAQNDAKLAREADADQLQRKYDADLAAANTPEALAERDRVCAKYGKPWK